MDVLVRRLVVDASGDALLSLVVQHTIGGAPARQELTVIVLVLVTRRSCPQEACAWEIRSCCTPRNFRRHCIRHLESGDSWA